MIDESNPFQPPIEAEVEPVDEKKRKPSAQKLWGVSFLIGAVTLALATIGMGFNDGTENICNLIITLPVFIGMPATLLSIVSAIVGRLGEWRIGCSVLLLPAHILICVINVWIAVIMCC